MTNPNKTRKGNQKPRIDIYHDGEISLAEKAIKLMDHYGLAPYPWQKAVIRRWLARTDEGKWANPTCGLIIPRQNGKTWLFRARILVGMIFLGEHLIYKAH